MPHVSRLCPLAFDHSPITIRFHLPFLLPRRRSKLCIIYTRLEEDHTTLSHYTLLSLPFLLSHLDYSVSALHSTPLLSTPLSTPLLSTGSPLLFYSESASTRHVTVVALRLPAMEQIGCVCCGCFSVWSGSSTRELCTALTLRIRTEFGPEA